MYTTTVTSEKNGVIAEPNSAQVGDGCSATTVQQTQEGRSLDRHRASVRCPFVNAMENGV